MSSPESVVNAYGRAVRAYLALAENLKEVDDELKTFLGLNAANVATQSSLPASTSAGLVPPTADPEPAATFSRDDIVAAYMAIPKLHRAAKAKPILAKLGAEKVTLIKPEDYAAAMVSFSEAVQSCQ